MPKKTPTPTPTPRTTRRNILIGIAVLLLLLLVLVLAAARMRTPAAPVIPSPSVSPSATSSVSPIPTRSPMPAPTPSSAPAPSTPVPTGSSNPPAPTGNFRSSAIIGLNGTEESTCQTEHGVVCYLLIKNTAGTEVARILIPEVDGTGGHLIDWPVKKYISTPGKYTVMGLAVVGPKSTPSSPYDLEVTP